ncbi:MAG: LptF/LptG family permease [Deltaproteobacteria bacterium]|nr:LptF/LptG family permease [Deltaproteobacteria bacterium]
MVYRRKGFEITIISRYLVREIIPQFLSTLFVFCSVIVISQLLRLSDVLVAFGLSFENLFLPFLFIIAPFLSVIIPISLLFALLISFLRLSMDGEYTALLSSGYSLRRILFPVFLVSLGAFVFAGVASMSLEAWGRREFERFVFRKTKTEIDNLIKFKIQEGVFVGDFLDYVFYTEKIAPDRIHYTHVLLAPSADEKKATDFVMTAEHAEIRGSVKEGFLRMVFHNGVSLALGEDGTTVSTLQYDKADIDLLRVFREKITGTGSADEDYRSYSIGRLYNFVDARMKEERWTEGEFLRARYLLHARLASPFLVFIFAIFGLILGIQEARKPKNWSYFLAILTVIGNFVLVAAFRWLAERGDMHGALAAWIPIGILLVGSAFLLYQKNRLPISENILGWRNLR